MPNGNLTMECPHISVNVKIDSKVVIKDSSKDWQCAGKNDPYFHASLVDLFCSSVRIRCPQFSSSAPLAFVHPIFLHIDSIVEEL